MLPWPEDRIESPVNKNKPALKSSKTPLKLVPSKKPAQKWATPEQVSELVEESNEPKNKKITKNMTLAERYEHFLQKSVV